MSSASATEPTTAPVDGPIDAVNNNQPELDTTSVVADQTTLNETIAGATTYQTSKNSGILSTAQSAITSAVDAIQLAIDAIQGVTDQTAVVDAAQEDLTSATDTLATATDTVNTAQDALDIAVLDNQAAEEALNTQTPITIAAQEANTVARDANDVAQSILVDANQAVIDQQAIVSADTAAVAAAQTAVIESAAPGLDKTIYQDTGYNNAPPLGAGVIKVITTDTNGINEQFGSGSPASGVLADDFQIKWTGNVSTTTDTSIRFYAPADDGVRLYIDNNLVINDWYDKGGGGSPSAPITFTANTPKPITLWFYENGGGASVVLYWSINGSGYVVVPASAFTRGSVDPILQAALDTATGTLQVDQATLNTLLEAQTTAQLNADTAYQEYIDANQAMSVAESIQAPIQQAAWDTRDAVELAANNLGTAQTSLAEAQSVVSIKQEVVNTEISTLNNLQYNAAILVSTANSLSSTADTATTSAVAAINATPTTKPIVKPEPPTDPQPPLEDPEEPTVTPEEPQGPDTPVEPTPQPPTVDPEPQNPIEEPSQPPVEEPVENTTTPEEQVNSAVEDANADGVVTDAEKEVIADALIEAADGGPVSAESIKEAGLEYKDLPPETPVEVRQDENGNEVIITADVAAALVLLESPSELIGAIFSDPGQALKALGSIGADMSPQEREEAQKMVVAAVIAGNAAINAVGAAAAAAGGPASGGSRSGGGGGSSGGGGASGDSKGVRRRRT